MRNRNGMTLVELQISTLLVTVVLIISGVIFWFSMSTMRFIMDGVDVYYNAYNLLNFLQKEIMISNRYGWTYGVDWGTEGQDAFGSRAPFGTQIEPPYSSQPNFTDSSYDELTSLHDAWGAYLNSSAGIILRQEPQPIVPSSTIYTEGVVLNETINAYNHADDNYCWIAFDPEDNVVRVSYQSNGVQAEDPTAFDGKIIARYVKSILFEKVNYNCVSISLQMQGNIPDPLTPTLRYHRPYFQTLVTLRCAPREPIEPAPDALTYW